MRNRKIDPVEIVDQHPNPKKPCNAPSALWNSTAAWFRVRRQWFCPDPRLPIAGLSYGNRELEVQNLVQARQLSLGAYSLGYVDLPNLN
jgi:hypothetical protein